MNNQQINPLREQINHLDKQLLEILEKRFEICKQIGKIKKQNGFSIEDKKREEEIVESRKSMSKLNPEFIEKLYSLIFQEAKLTQEKNETNT